MRVAIITRGNSVRSHLNSGNQASNIVLMDTNFKLFRGDLLNIGRMGYLSCDRCNVSHGSVDRQTVRYMD